MIYALFFLAGAVCTLAVLGFLCWAVLAWIDEPQPDTTFAQRMRGELA